MAESKAREKETRSRAWTVVQYDDSAPENWRELIDEQHIEWIESPLHDQDVNADGERKKPHRHLVLMFGSVKSYDQVLEFTQTLHCPIPMRCHNVKAMVRYMAHMDNPEKHQYNVSDIKPHGGVDLEELLRPSSSQRYELIRDMIRFVKEKHVTEFQDLMDYAAESRYDDWFPLLCDNSAFVVSQYIKSQRHRVEAPVRPSRPVQAPAISTNGKPQGEHETMEEFLIHGPLENSGFLRFINERCMSSADYLLLKSDKQLEIWRSYQDMRHRERFGEESRRGGEQE